MTDLEIKVQDCGCICIPEELAASLGIGPGTSLRLTSGSDYRTLVLRALSPPTAADYPAERTACPVAPTAP